MDFLELVNFYIIPGLVIGSIYALGAVGITLVFAILRYAHLAHGDLATLGAFLALAVVTGFGISPLAALPIAILGTAAVAVGIDKVFYEHLRERPKIVTVMASLGIALMVRAVVQVIWGVDSESYVKGIVRPDVYFGLRIRDREIYTVIAMIALVGVLQVFLTQSKWGKAMRAMSDNPNLALLSGIDNKKVVMLTWIIAGGLCAAAGVFLGINTELKSMMGWNMLLPMFAAAILGGVGRVEGAVLGGLIVGVAEELSVLVLPSEYKAATAFAILLFMLLVRPTGLLRGKVL
ncbi:branched-chain amino acid transport system permease protein [Roseibium hamelinense]|uniref:Branched-chain amino acid transport system permease protein n=1 Tax=Roseibium hamelinense TaxID=150831 RepID=A0A562T3C8_9HYPH|nr:branched-chain amino acid ABC transporter permease [Roseibium hamelinense]MTI44498.1 branched-chain amino acid ABC transporter permease [Roseibium hamelinense]TWI87466.1 branched-chain amino acid transport system permease protein [Roseibium hamelinense]